MPKSKYDTPESQAVRDAAVSQLARKQMLAQWERQRAESGQSLGYYGCHRRVRRVRGRAAEQPCVGCGQQARHWAHVHDTDPTDVQNYQAMCQRCHWAYDGVGAKTAAAKDPAARREVALRAWETKRRKQATTSAPDPSLAGDG